MDFDNVGRASSAGYRLPERAKGSGPITKQAPAAESLPRRKDTIASSTRLADATDPVKQDQAWKEIVWSERRAVLEWDKNWSFLRNYDRLGELKTEENFPDKSSFFSNCSPNTSNQIFGSRLSTPLGRELMRLDRLLSWSGSGRHHKRKLER
ncbi:ciliary microtubule inner protein 5 [Festucalex cinctus]